MQGKNELWEGRRDKNDNQHHPTNSRNRDKHYRRIVKRRNRINGNKNTFKQKGTDNEPRIWVTEDLWTSKVGTYQQERERAWGEI